MTPAGALDFEGAQDVSREVSDVGRTSHAETGATDLANVLNHLRLIAVVALQDQGTGCARQHDQRRNSQLEDLQNLGHVSPLFVHRATASRIKAS